MGCGEGERWEGEIVEGCKREVGLETYSSVKELNEYCTQ